MARLTLSTVGIKSPVDLTEVASDPRPVARASAENATPSPRPPRRAAARTPVPRASRPRLVEEQPSGGEVPFYGRGRPLQTSVSMDEELLQLLEELARAARVSVNALVVAGLQAGLPTQADRVCEAIVEERVRRAGVVPARLVRNLRLPEQMRTRIDELTAAARERLPRVSRADLLNAALRSGLPSDAEGAAELVGEYARRLERAAVA